MRIGDVARRTGASVRSLRYYEQRGLIVSARTEGGQRVYDGAVVERVELIQVLIRAGVHTEAITDLLPCIYSGTATPAMVERLVAERERIDAQARELAATRDRLDHVIACTRDHLASRTSRPARPA